MILIPVKNLGRAKQRLAAFLDQKRRTALAQAMLEDVLESVLRWQRRPQVGIVTQDGFALGLARQHGCEVIPDPANQGETHAIEVATEYCRSRGAAYSLVLPADIPLVSADELEAIFSGAPEAGSVLVPARDRRGTNAVLRAPPALFPLRFGNDSFRPHLQAARRTLKPAVVLELPGIGLDIDRLDDLRELASALGATRSQELVRGWYLGEPALAASQ